MQQRPVVDDEGEDNGEEACAGLELKHTQGSRAQHTNKHTVAF